MGVGTTPVAAAYPQGFPSIEVVGDCVSLTLFVPGTADQKIEPAHRPRARVIPGPKPRPQIYNDKRTTDWEQYVADMVEAQVLTTPVKVLVGDPAAANFVLPFKDSRVLIDLRFNLPKPPSYPARVVHHTKKPDLDNYAKAVIDGLVKARLLKDDGMVTDENKRKRYIEPGHPHGVEIEVTIIPCEVA